MNLREKRGDVVQQFQGSPWISVEASEYKHCPSLELQLRTQQTKHRDQPRLAAQRRPLMALVAQVEGLESLSLPLRTFCAGTAEEESKRLPHNTSRLLDQACMRYASWPVALPENGRSAERLATRICRKNFGPPRTLCRLDHGRCRAVYSAVYTTLPPTMVWTTFVFRISSAGQAVMSLERTTMSASVPGERVPLLSSSKAAKAQSRV